MGLAVVVLGVGPATWALAESCPPAWTPELFPLVGTDAEVNALTVFDDGTGPALYVGGHFTTAGVAANRIAKWDGTQWSPLGSGMGGNAGPYVYALTVFDDDEAGPHPPALYAGGNFTTAGGVPANHIAKWDGTQWSALGSGMAGGFQPDVRALTVFDDDGAGPHPPALYAGGVFTMAGGVAANSIAKWDGTQWSALGSGIGGGNYVLALTVYNSELIAGGQFTTAGGVSAVGIAKWDGTQWSALGSGIGGGNYVVFALTVYSGELIAGGNFTTMGGVSANNIAKWDGAQWSPLGSGIGGHFYNRDVWALTVFDDDGAGPHSSALYAGGRFDTAGGVSAILIARWDGTRWTALANEIGGTDPFVSALIVFDDDGVGSHPPKLYTGGYFALGGDTLAINLAKWDGMQWSLLGSGLNGSVYSLLNL